MLRKEPKVNSKTVLNYIPNGFVSNFKITDKKSKLTPESEYGFWYYSENIGGFIHGEYLKSGLENNISKGLYLKEEESEYKVSEIKANLELIKNEIMENGKPVGTYSIQKEKLILEFKDKGKMERCFSKDSKSFLKCK